MKKFADFIAHKRILVLIVAVILLLPAAYGYFNTPINYDILTYLPEGLNSVMGETIIADEFNDAATSMLVVEGMDTNDIVKLKEKIAKVDSVEKVIWIDDALDVSVPAEILPDDFKDILFQEDSTMMIIKYTGQASDESTLNAISDIRGLLNEQCFLSGISTIVKDTKELADKEAPIYVMIAVILSIIVLSLTNKSVFIPFIFLLSTGFAIIYNFGTNMFLGQISYITKSLAAVLQLGVTMDYSIFLMHRYDEELENFSSKEEAMSHAITKTLVSISGSSLTTIAGFLALCVMDLTLGKDIGIVMAKGVFIGLISTITILPALILIFDKPIHRFRHRTVLPTFERTAKVVTSKYGIFVGIFLLAFIPAIYGNNHTSVYYNLDESLPKDLPSIVATEKLKDQYNMTTTHFIALDSDIQSFKVKDISDRIEDLDGINNVLSYSQLVGPGIPEEFIPEEIISTFKNDNYQLLIANSEYKAARDEENEQIDQIYAILADYDSNAYVTGEGVLTKDLIEIADSDFKRVSIASIIAIFAIIMVVFQSVTIPIILVMSIELAIFINMGIPFYTGSTIPFIASIVIGCIQLGATVDYAILMTNRFREEIRNGFDKKEAARIAVQGSARSIVTSGLTFFAATAGVGIFSDMDIVKSLCTLLARGALVSMVIIVFILPSLLLVSEKVISVTSLHWKDKPSIKKAIKARTADNN
ncbi:efflux RND transporter permease subunit [Clostridium sp. DL1XJH146]